MGRGCTAGPDASKWRVLYLFIAQTPVLQLFKSRLYTPFWSIIMQFWSVHIKPQFSLNAFYSVLWAWYKRSNKSFGSASVSVCLCVCVCVCVWVCVSVCVCVCVYGCARVCTGIKNYVLNNAVHKIIMLQLCLRAETSFWWVITFTGQICRSLPSVRRELRNMIRDRAASHPLCQSPANVIVTPLINMLKTVNHCSPASWENHSIPW